MPFDANLVLIDGTIALTSETDTPAVSATRLASTGAAVVDLKETGVKGLAAVLVLPSAATASGTLTGIIEGSEEVAFGESTYYNKTLGMFNIAGATDGVILAAETPAIVVLRFTTKLRYVRAVLTVNDSGTYSFGYVQVLLSPYPFDIL